MKKSSATSLGDVIGLDIGAATIRAALVRGENVVLWGQTPTPPAAIDRGLVADPHALAGALQRLWQEVGFDSRRVALSLSNGRSQFALVSVVEPVQQRKEQIELAVKTLAETQFSPTPLDQLALDYRELSATTTDSAGNSRLQLQLAAADRSMVGEYFDVLKRAKLQPVACELGPLAAARALLYPYSPSSAHLVIEIGAERTRFVVVNGTDVLYMRAIEIGGNDFSLAVAKLLACPLDEAEAVKMTVGLDAQVSDAQFSGEAAAIAEALQEPADRLIQAVTEARRAYEMRVDSRTLDGFTLLGGGGELRGLAALVSLYLNLPGPAPIELRPGLAVATDQFATALGLASGQEMSLIPDGAFSQLSLGRPARVREPRFNLRRARGQVRKLKRRRRTTNPLFAALGVLVGAVFLSYGAAYELRKPLAPLPPVAATSPQFGPQYTNGSTAAAAQKAVDLLAVQPAVPYLAFLARIADRNHLLHPTFTASGQTLSLGGTATQRDAQAIFAELSKNRNLAMSSPKPSAGKGPTLVSYYLTVKDAK